MSRWHRIYPFLAALWSPLHLAASNAGEWVQLSDLEKPVLIAVTSAVIGWFGVRPLTSDPDKRAFLAFVAVIAFTRGRPVVGLLAILLPESEPYPSIATLLLFALTGTLLVVGTINSKRSFAPASQFLGYMAALLVAFSLAQLLTRSGQPAQPVHSRLVGQLDSSTALGDSRPTIYLIVLDKYQGSPTLRSYYGFDNTSFEDALKERGFVLPRHARANYTHTRPAMSALLNSEYLDSLVATVGEESVDPTPLFASIEDNRAVALLQHLGYEFVFFPNQYEPFRRNRHADLQLPSPEAIRPELATVWIESTLIVPLVALACRVVPRACVYVPGVAEAPTLTDWKFEQLGRLARSAHPRFILAHFLVPHEPYVYRADCQHIEPALSWPDSASIRTAYLDQIKCVNRKVLAAVDAILRHALQPPVILLQSDHGNGHLPRDNMKLQEASTPMIQARIDVLAAYYVPGAPDTLFYDGITSVNLLPRVFGHLFHTRSERRPDRSYWASSSDRPYRFALIPPDLLGEAR